MVMEGPEDAESEVERFGDEDAIVPKEEAFRVDSPAWIADGLSGEER
jgi:hypothetical protein